MKDKIEDIEKIRNLSKDINGSYVFIWQHDKITIRSSDAFVIPSLDDIVELRIFNAKKELLVKRIGKDLFYRLKDDAGKVAGQDYVEKQAVLRGNIAKEAKDFVQDLAKANLEKIAILKREYIEYNDLGVAGYVDSRFVNFKTLD